MSSKGKLGVARVHESGDAEVDDGSFKLKDIKDRHKKKGCGRSRASPHQTRFSASFRGRKKFGFGNRS